jgi:hypothetical protein
MEGAAGLEINSLCNRVGGHFGIIAVRDFREAGVHEERESDS